MQIEFRQAFTAPQQTVWDYLQNPQVLEKTLPGCKKFHQIGERRYSVELGLDIGPVKGLFSGSVDLLELVEPNQYRLILKGSGKPGELEADARIYLHGNESGTDLKCSADTHVTGIMASVGQRIVGGVARALLSRFFKNVEGEIKKAATPS